MRTITTASWTSISSTRPPCPATIGFTWRSNRSATRSYRASSSATAATAAAGLGATAWPLATAARIAWPTAFPTTCHGVALRLTTVTRFPDTITSATPAPGIAKIASASGEPLASSTEAKRRTPPACSGSLTTNLQRPPSIGSAVIRRSVALILRTYGLRQPGGNAPEIGGRSCSRRRGRRAQLPRGLHQVAQRRQRLLPATRLQAAVGVDPDLAVVEHLLHALQRLRDLGGARDPGGMDVVDPRADFVRIVVLLECLEQLRSGARVLDRDDVGVHLLDHADDVVELAIAHVGVDLGRIRHPGRREPERVHRPLEVGGPVGPAERQSLSQRRLVDLDHPDPRDLEISHLIADRQRQLFRGLGARLIVPHERPLQDRHRAGQHSLHRAGGLGLGEGAPAYRHRPGPRDVAVDDRRLHVARAVGLHPAVLGERESLELLAEVLHHVVALELAVHEHIEAELFLQLQGA